MSNDLKKLTSRRGQIKSQLTRFTGFLDDTTNHSKITEISTRLQRIEQGFDEFDTVQSQIEIIDESTEQLDERTIFEEKFFSAISMAKDLINNKMTVNSNSLSNSNVKSNECTSNTQFNIKLPQLSLPEFNGAYDKWSSFSDTFISLIHNNPCLTDIQKYFYLQSSLKGDAAKVIDSLEVDASNYPVAWNLLKNRFEDKKIIIKNHLQNLFELQTVNKDSYVSLRAFNDSFLKHYRALKNLGEPVESWSTILIYLLVSKLDGYTKKEWLVKTAKEISPPMQIFIEFLSDRCKLLEATETNKNIKNLPNNKHFPNNKKFEPSFNHVATNKTVCFYCKGNHLIYHCKDFLELPPSQRFSEIKKYKACINCLRRGHSAQECNGSSCRTCNKRHNTLLHFDTSTQVNEPNQHMSKDQQVEQISQVLHNAQNNTVVLLSTALLYINDAYGNFIQCRALLDSGSQSNFMTNELFNRLNIPFNKINIPISGIGSSKAKITRTTNAEIHSKYTNYQTNISFLIMDKITDNIPQNTFRQSLFKIPENITLADPTFFKAGKIDILIGASIFYQLLSIGQIKNNNNQPVLQKTKLGWVIGGNLSTDDNPLLSALCNFSRAETNEVDKQLEKFWNIEECSQRNVIYSIEEAECESHFVETFQRDPSGRFIVKLPLRENFNQLGDSLDMAIQRFQSLERKFSKNAHIKKQYSNFMSEYLKLGHMTKIATPDRFSDLTFYLPHHCVLKESSLTTKLRVVFDASAKSSSGISLNDVLKVGPVIQEDVFSIMLRFRLHNIVFTADIEKCYRQIQVHEDYRDLQRIVWRSDPSAPLEHYRLNTITYGTGPASFLATRCLKQLALENEQKFPEASRAIAQDFYMDDWISGADSFESAVELLKQVNKILSDSKLILRQWISNKPNVLLNQLSSTDKTQFVIKDTQSSKTLGIFWDATNDVFQYLTNPTQKNVLVTKRQILSIIAQIFDPLGLIGPVITTAKIILQRIWKLKLGWDDELPQELLVIWSQFYSNLPMLNTLQIPRHISLQNYSYSEIHVFCDASQLAYGSCVYLRTKNVDGDISVKLACSKSRVAPVSGVTLPRLELCGALLSTKLCKKVLDSFKIHIDRIYYWTDSTIVLCWINSDASTLKTFVSNRISQIQSLTDSRNWRHVPTDSNPADIISRGINPQHISQNHLWWNGPSWLSVSDDYWPKQYPLTFNKIPETKIVTLIVTNDEPYAILTRFSSFKKMVKVVAYLLRFRKNASVNRTSRNTGSLSVIELSYSTNVIIKMVQKQEFHNEINSLSKSASVHNQSKLICLSPFLDEHGIIRVGGRLRNSSLSFNNKHPIVIPSKHHFTTLLIKYEHHKNLHAGPQSVLSSIRLKYWPLNGRRVVRNVLQKCVTCFRAKPKSIYPKMGDLPSSRVSPTRPFHISGVDYCGPYLIKDSKFRNRKFIKSYVCIFICFSSKAVHLELVSDLTTEGFLNALKRFVSRRGLCSHLYSDNATNFAGAKNVLLEASKFSKDELFQDYLSQNKITWHNIPPRSPHFGGLWESAVRLTKHHLIRILKSINLSYEEFITLLTQVESILNSRPLTPLTDDPNDLQCLTPGHFLIGEPLLAVPESIEPDICSNHVSRYRHLKILIQRFWSRWKSDYLQQLQPRSRWQQQPVSDLRIGSLVILKDDNTPPLLWKMGRVVELFPGQDDIVRVVAIKTYSGIVKRAVTRVCVLPTEN